MIVQSHRMERGWSQEDLATLSGLSVRTIQRIERGQPARHESYKAIAAALDVDFSQLQEDSVSDTAHNPEKREFAMAFSQVQRLKAFYSHAASFVLVNLMLVVLNLWLTPQVQWFWFVIGGWGIGIACHAAQTFDILPWLGPDWERREVEKRLGHPIGARRHENWSDETTLN